MGRRPQRDAPKRAIQFWTDADMRGRLAPLLHTPKYGASSLSRLVEDLLFMQQIAYVEQTSEEFFRGICETRAARLTEMARLGFEPERVLVHVSVDEGACAFADELVRRFPRLFSSRRDLCDQLLFGAALHCGSDAEARWFQRRLEQVVRVFPRTGPYDAGGGGGQVR